MKSSPSQSECSLLTQFASCSVHLSCLSGELYFILFFLMIIELWWWTLQSFTVSETFVWFFPLLLIISGASGRTWTSVKNISLCLLIMPLLGVMMSTTLDHSYIFFFLQMLTDSPVNPELLPHPLWKTATVIPEPTPQKPVNLTTVAPLILFAGSISAFNSNQSARKSTSYTSLHLILRDFQPRSATRSCSQPLSTVRWPHQSITTSLKSFFPHR